jgi:predicted membrane channel-forming protein YqfA (hemolysin III family)
MSVNRPDRNAGYHLAGWILFVVCAFLFLCAAARDRDLLLIMASLVFLAGCVAFLVPLLRKDKRLPPEGEHPESDRK